MILQGGFHRLGNLTWGQKNCQSNFYQAWISERMRLLALFNLTWGQNSECQSTIYSNATNLQFFLVNQIGVKKIGKLQKLHSLRNPILISYFLPPIWFTSKNWKFVALLKMVLWHSEFRPQVTLRCAKKPSSLRNPILVKYFLTPIWFTSKNLRFVALL